MPRRTPRRVGSALVFAAVLLLAGFLLAPGAAQWPGWLAALAFLLAGLGIDLENMAQARRRARAYHALGIAIPSHLRDGLRWRPSPGGLLLLVVAAYALLGALNATHPLPEAVLLLALVALVLNPFVVAFFVFRRRVRQREAEMRAFAEQQGLTFSEEGKGWQRTFVAQEDRDGPRVYCVQTDKDLSLMVPIRKSRESLGLQPATLRGRRATARAGLSLHTGDPAFERQFTLWNSQPQRAGSFLADADVRRTLLLLNEVAPLHLTIGERTVSIEQAYGEADRGYWRALLSVALRLARRWDGRDRLDLPDAA